MGFFDRVKKAFGGSTILSEGQVPTQVNSESTSESAADSGLNSTSTSLNSSTVVTSTSETNEDVNPTSTSTKPTINIDTEEQVINGRSETSSESEQENNNQIDLEQNKSDQVSKSETKDYDQGLAKSRQGFSARLNNFLANFRTVDEDFFADLEEMLIEADVGFETAMTISDELRDEVKLKNAKSKKQVAQVIVEKMVDLYGEAGVEEDNQLHFSTTDTPTVFLFVGVNGAGKTTTVGKLAARLKSEGKRVLLAAADTFRAGAIEQLQEWGRRTGVDVVASAAGSDPASVVFEAVKKVKEAQYDILLVDTAGRLQNKVNLMNELAKIKRVIVREIPEAPQEVLLVLDASTGQNALSQAKQFKETTKVSGIVLTKLDGSSKGGIVIAIRNELHLPVKLVGLGEKVTDLQDFNAEKFIYGLFKGLIDNAS